MDHAKCSCLLIINGRGVFLCELLNGNVGQHALKKRDIVLVDLSKDISSEDKMRLRNSPVWRATDLFPFDLLNSRTHSVVDA